MERNPLEIRVELAVIEDLGIKLYGHLPPVISEMISNAWDADATLVEISLPDGNIGEDSKIVIRDNGHGMSYEDIADLYLRIGRKRRVENQTDRTPNDRRVIGRKGIGKLSVFGVANTVDISTTKGGTVNEFRMNIGDILKAAESRHAYRPEIIREDERTNDGSGTVITLSLLKRKSKINPEMIARSVARHFSIIGEKFRVAINGKDISPSDKFGHEDFERKWRIDDEGVDENHPSWTVSGWIGATKKTLDAQDVGITVMARGKLVQTSTTFEIKSGGKYSYSYLTGEINAEFLDEEQDLISTNRQSLIWDEPKTAALQKWGRTKLRLISEELTRDRKDRREKVIREDPKFKSWIETLTKPERGVADRIISIIASEEKLDDPNRKEIVSYIMESFDQKVFKDMVASLKDHDDPVTLLEMFKQWDVIEAREVTRVVKGRLDTIEQFGRLVDRNAKEVPEIHRFLKEWPWILEPTWTKWQDEIRYSKLLREKYPDAVLNEPDRRIDFISIGVGDTIHVVEIKRPQYKIKSKDLDQLMEYVEFVREHLGNVSERGYNDVAGYIIVGSVSNERVIKTKINESKGHRRYVKTYEDLIVVARQLHSAFEEKLSEFKPRKL